MCYNLGVLSFSILVLNQTLHLKGDPEFEIHNTEDKQQLDQEIMDHCFAMMYGVLLVFVVLQM